jgi:hypothetical protein
MLMATALSMQSLVREKLEKLSPSRAEIIHSLEWVNKIDEEE